MSASEIESERSFSGPTGENKCNYCKRTFAHSQSMYRHVKKFHPGQKILYAKKSYNICCLCDESLYTIVLLQKHMAEKHGIKLRHEKKTFFCDSDFKEWKDTMEKETLCHFVIHRSQVELKDGRTVVHFQCSRSGMYKPSGNGERHLKIAGSQKIDKMCPAYMSAYKTVVDEAIEIVVKFQSVHAGHEAEICRLPLTMHEKTELAVEMNRGVPKSTVLWPADSLRTSGNSTMRYCCVPGCDSGRRDEQKRMEEEGIKRKIRFRVPKNFELLNKWDMAVPLSRKLDSNDTVCELHFQEEDIERYWITKIKDGSISKIERSRITLKPGAVPSIFPNLSTLINPVARQSGTSKNIVAIKTGESSSQDSVSSRLELSDDTQGSYEYFENDERDTDANSLQQMENMDVNFRTKYAEKNSLQNETVSYKCVSFSYDILLQNLSHIKKPTLWWSITPVIEVAHFIGCVRWNCQFGIEKRVVIDCDLNVKVFIKERQIVIPDFLKISSIEEVSYLLMKVENFGICRTTLEQSQSNCLVCLTNSGMGRRPLYCSNCASERKKEFDRTKKRFERNSELKNEAKVKNLQMKHACVLRRNNRMRLKISNLRMIIEDYKEINTELKKVIKQVSISDSQQDYVQKSADTYQNS